MLFVKNKSLNKFIQRTKSGLELNHGTLDLVKAAVSRFELPWQIFAKSDSCPFSCREIYALPEKRCFQFFFGVLTSQ